MVCQSNNCVKKLPFFYYQELPFLIRQWFAKQNVQLEAWFMYNEEQCTSIQTFQHDRQMHIKSCMNNEDIYSYTITNV